MEYQFHPREELAKQCCGELFYAPMRVGSFLATVAYRGEVIFALYLTRDHDFLRQLLKLHFAEVERHVYFGREVVLDRFSVVKCFGSLLQQKVWQALTTLQKGEICSYSELAARSGYERSVRAVATAIGQNRVAYLLPCHRVVPKSQIKFLQAVDNQADTVCRLSAKRMWVEEGDVGGYLFGNEVKRALLAAELAP